MNVGKFNGDVPVVADAKFAPIDSCSQPSHLPVRKQEISQRRITRTDSWDSTDESDLSAEFDAKKFDTGDSNSESRFMQAALHPPLRCQQHHVGCESSRGDRPLRRLISSRSSSSLNSCLSLSASAKFATTKCDRPLHVPQHDPLSQSFVSTASAVSQSWRSLFDDFHIRKETSAKFATTKRDRPLHVPQHDPLSQSFVSTASAVSQSWRSLFDDFHIRKETSAKFATTKKCDRPLHVPQHDPLCQSFVSTATTVSESWRSFGDDADIQKETLQRTETYTPEEDADHERTLHIRNTAEDNYKESNQEAKFLARDHQDKALHVPMRQLSHGTADMVPESPIVGDQLGLSVRFSMADFEEPLNLPLRQQSQHYQSVSTLDSLTEDDLSFGGFGDLDEGEVDEGVSTLDSLTEDDHSFGGFGDLDEGEYSC